MAQIISGKDLAKEVKATCRQTIEEYRQANKRIPMLAVVLVGDNPASLSYVKGKDKACHEVGILSRMIHLPTETTQEELENIIEELNRDQTVDGVLIQLPLPNHLNEKKVLLKLDPDKDVDGLHPVNAGRLMLNEKGFVPCTPLGIMAMLNKIGCDLQGKQAVVLGRSALVGNPIAQLLMRANATVTICHSKTQNIEAVTRQADVVIAAIGKPKLVTKEWIKPGAVVIDVGINRVDGKLVGDVNFEEVEPLVEAITPVPGGVGPMTIAMLLENTILAYQRKEGIEC